MLIRIDSHKAKITTSPSAGDCSPKKEYDQKTLSPSWTQNITMDSLTSLLLGPVFHTRKSDTAIIRYSAVQTGAKSQLGGVRAGFRRLAYHVGMAGVVKKAPIAAAT